VSAPPHDTAHRSTAAILRWIVGIAAALAVVVVLWNIGERVVGGETASWASYALIAALVFGDAVFPVLPGETTLNAGAVLAANGELGIGLVMVSGALGAVAGDSCVYWIARKARGRVRAWMDRAGDSPTGARVLRLLRERGPVFLLFGRYIPGVRFALNATLGGVVRMPYPTFVFWSAISGTLWSVLTCAGAYFVGNALAGYPLLSLIITCVLSTALITGAIWAENKWSSRHGGRPARDPG
jgi:membrane protein DedA with SNARE-associated domain